VSCISGISGIFKEIFEGIFQMPQTMRQLAVVQFFTWFGLFCMWLYFVPGMGVQVFGGQTLGEHLEGSAEVEESSALEYVAAAKLALARTSEDAAEPVRLQLDDYVASVADLVDRGVALPELTPLERRNPLYTTTAYYLSSGVTAGDPSAAAAALTQRLDEADKYEAGVRKGQTSMGNYNLVAFFFSFMLLWLVRKFSAKSIHGVCLVLGGIGLILAGSTSSLGLIFLAMVLLGLAWASILSMPYAMLSNVIPEHKMGFYMGVFNFFIVLPQILASLGLGVVMKTLLGGNAMNAVVLGGASFLVAAVMLLRVSTEATET